MHYNSIILLLAIFPTWKDALYYNISNVFLSTGNTTMGLLFLQSLETV